MQFNDQDNGSNYHRFAGDVLTVGNLTIWASTSRFGSLVDVVLKTQGEEFNVRDLIDRSQRELPDNAKEWKLLFNKLSSVERTIEFYLQDIASWQKQLNYYNSLSLDAFPLAKALETVRQHANLLEIAVESEINEVDGTNVHDLELVDLDALLNDFVDDDPIEAAKTISATRYAKIVTASNKKSQPSNVIDITRKLAESTLPAFEIEIDQRGQLAFAF